MTILYKLTDAKGFTRRGETNECKWGPGISHSGTGKGELCGPGYIHAYEHPLLAVLLNLIHADLKNPRLWKAEGKIAERDGQLKVGCRTLITVEEIPLPAVTISQRIRFAILCAKQVYKEPNWNQWADNWLSNKDRARAEAEWSAVGPASEADAAVAKVAAGPASEAEWAAAKAAERAAKAAAEVVAWAAAKAAAEAAEWAEWAAWVAKAAAWAAGRSAALNLITIAIQACSED